MTAALVLLAIVAILAPCVTCVALFKMVRAQTAELLEEERKRTADWWKRSQRHIDNLQDRVMASQWEVYAAATQLDHPADLAQEEILGSEMANSMLDQIRRQASEDMGYDLADVADDFASFPIVG